MPKFSIVVPVYRVEAYLDRCVQSLLHQTLDDIEIILVDDGSPDRCPAICDRYAAQDERVKVIHKANEGVSAARNDGLAAASGEWVLFCDSDDWMEPNACELLYRTGTQKEVDVVVGDIYLIRDGLKKYNQFFELDFVWRSRRRLDQLVAADICQSYCPLPPKSPSIGYGGPWNKAVRRQFLLQQKITFDTRLHGIFDDILYTAFLYAKAKSVAYIRRPVYNYLMVPNSITKSYRPDSLAVNRQIFRAFQDFIDAHAPDDQWQQAYYAMVIRRLEETLRLYFFHRKNKKAFRRTQAELRHLAATQPYAAAIQRADKKKLSSSQRKALFLLRTQQYFGLWALYRIKTWMKKI